MAKDMAKKVQQLDQVVIRFAGDSGDGMQLTGDRFTSETAQLGNDISTLPNFPAEIRAPAGTLPGVSSFQIHFADTDILVPLKDHLTATGFPILTVDVYAEPASVQAVLDNEDNPAARTAKVEDLVDYRFADRLRQSGFYDSLPAR